MFSKRHVLPDKKSINPPICPSETQEIHRNPRSLLEFYHVFNHVLPEYHQFLLFFSTCLNIFLEQKFPSILDHHCCDDVHPIFVHRFSLRKSIFSPFFHHFSRKSTQKMLKNPSENLRSFFRRGAKCMTSLGRQLSGRMATGRLESEPWRW